MDFMRRLRQRLMLTCEDVNYFLVEYLDGSLDEKTRERFEKHISKCPQCRLYLEQYRETIASARDADDTPAALPDELTEKTLVFLRKHYRETY